VSLKLPKAGGAEYGRVFRSCAADFIQEQRFAVFGSVGRDGDVWASIRTGEPGFLRVLDTFTVKTEPLQVEGDPLIENLRANGDVGMLIIDFATRRRMRLNGEAEVLHDHSLHIHAREVYSNCPQYIQKRRPEAGQTIISDNAAPVASRAGRLSASQQRWIARADTFFIASAHPELGVDASHRDGNPGSSRLSTPAGSRFPTTMATIRSTLWETSASIPEPG
jgi:predicted pyridoxine 5'-phosphate oxidase superfamily flavin-nucleotide-binding protein